MKTHNVKPTEVQKKWVVVDAEGQVLGRLAAEVASVLRGKNKPTYTPHLDTGDNVVIINADKIKLTGNKWRDKVYYHHTSYIGGIKAIRAEDLVATYPDRLITLAVKGMLPKNRLGRKIIGNLKVYSGSEHPHVAQKPVQATPRTAQS